MLPRLVAKRTIGPVLACALAGASAAIRQARTVSVALRTGHNLEERGQPHPPYRRRSMSL